MATEIRNWQKNILLEGFSSEELLEIASIAKEVRFEKHELIVEEGSKGEQFFFIVSGSLEVLKEGRRIHILEAGDVVGELAILGGKPRIATVRAIQPTVVQEVIVKNLSSGIIDKLAKNLSYLFSSRLATTNQLTAEAMHREVYQIRRRSAMSATAAKSIVLIPLYVLIARQMLNFLPYYYFPIFSGFYLAIMAYYLCWDLYKQGYPLSMFGVTLRNWKLSIKETLLFMSPLLLAIVIVKKILIITNSAYAGQSLFRLGLETTPTTPQQHFLLSAALIMYIIFSPIQELIFRGVVQTSWQRFSTGAHRTLVAITVTSILYLNAHFYWSLSILVLIPSFLWGWLFARHRTLIGVSMGHMLIGVWLFWIVGLNL